jgi:endonuclease/exonuclease/phosphatase family metal-dependent hydrolase
MRFHQGLGLLLWLGAVLLVPDVSRGQHTVRVATYNIAFLKETIPSTRIDRLKQVIARLDAHVIALQEIENRQALEQIFPPAEWALVIDDDSGDAQDLAVVVRREFKVILNNSSPTDLDADNPDFLFPGQAHEVEFPNRRDVLKVQIEEPRSRARFFLFVIHAKSRGQDNRPARAFTEPRRVGAAEKLLKVLEERFDEQDFIVLGDFNDNPDDRSLNILESGDPNAPAGVEEIPGPFLINLCEPLVSAGHVSIGRTQADIQNGKINTIDPLSRTRNISAVGTNAHTGDILFDQLLIPVRMAERHVLGSTRVFDDPVAVLGPDVLRASDHLPVYADFVFEDDEDGTTPIPSPTAPAGVRIVALLPNPEGRDEGREWVALRNTASQTVSLDGWKLRDRSGPEFVLRGDLAAGERKRFDLPTGVLPLNNGGDNIALIDPSGETRQRVTYTSSQAGSGEEVTIE